MYQSTNLLSEFVILSPPYGVEDYRKTKIAQKNLVCDAMEKLTFPTFCKYMFFSLSYSLVRLIVLFIF